MRASTAGGIALSDLQPVPLKRFSALPFDGVADVAPAINAALVSLRDSGGGLLLLPAAIEPGVLSEPVVLQNLTGIAGEGFATALRLAPGVDDHVITNHVSADGVEPNAEFVVVRDLRVLGAKADQSAGGGIYFEVNPLTTQAAGDEDFDPHQLVENVYIYDCKGSGFAQAGRSETRLVNVLAAHCDEYGFDPSYDTFLELCTAAHAGRAGFRIGSSACRLTNCKAFYSGRLVPAEGAGFRIDTVGGAMLSACEAQDNEGPGFGIYDAPRGSTLAACIADSNSTRGAGLNPGFDVDASHHNRIAGCAAYERRADGANSYQTHALRLVAGSSDNHVALAHYAAGGAVIAAALDPASDSVDANRVEINNEGGLQEPAFAASFTPDPYAGSTIVLTLTGNITINLPAAANFHAGSTLTFVLIEDAVGGRTITLNAGYKRVWTPITTANKVNTISFVYTGAAWVQTGGVVNL